MTELPYYIQQFNPTVDSENRLHISCICDGTLLFAAQLVEILKAVGCTDIKLDDMSADKSEIPKDKPWCNYKFLANGLLPKTE